MADVNSESNIDYWKIPKFDETDVQKPLVEKSTFRILFPQYREAYFKNNWSRIKNELDNHSVQGNIDYIEGSVTVETTDQIGDPYIIIKARDMIKLIARSVSFDSARKILQEDIFCEIIPLNTKRLSKEKFSKRRARLIGPNGNTVKALEILCGCTIHVQGKTTCVIGSLQAIKALKATIDDTMSNVHPVYNLKSIMVKRELAQNDKMKDQSWGSYVPKYKSKTVKKKTMKFTKRDTSAFPPPPVLSKIDKELETGEYFLKKHEKREKDIQKRLDVQKSKVVEKKMEKMAAFVAPQERCYQPQQTEDTTISVFKFKKNLNKCKQKTKK